MKLEKIEKICKENNIKIAKKMKPFPSILGLEEDFKYKYLTEKGKWKYEGISVKTLVQYIFNKKFVGEYFYKDFATYEKPYESEKGFIKWYDKKLGIWKNAEEFLKDKTDEFFSDEDTKDIIKSCKFTLNKDTRTSDNNIIYVSIIHEINKVLKKLHNHWNTSFEKEYLTISFKNGTLFLFQKTGEYKFLEIKHQDFLSEIYFNTNFDKNKLENRKNRLSHFLSEKVELDTKEKIDYFNAILFDFFLTENESHHTLFFIGKKGSGKSTFMKHIRGCSSMQECTIVVDLQKMVGEKFTNPKWFQYPFIFTNETREKYIEDNATFKQMIAKEEITIEQKMNHLDVGEFVLLLPEHLRSEEEHYKSVFEDDLTSRMSSRDERQQMTATVGYLESGQDRFVYNTTPISYQQFLKDPIIIVITPQSTGPQSILFWVDAVQNYVLFNQLSDAQELIQRQGIENWVSEMQTGYHNYITLLDNIQRERWVMLAGAVLGIATSILLFNTMNRLYFEEFRRAIFIKRIAGLRFLEIHRTYLFAQLGVFLLGFVASVFLMVEIVVAFLVSLLFTGLSLLQLHVQMQKENKMSMLVLKGG